jgi:RND superfamily putative drug exporter
MYAWLGGIVSRHWAWVVVGWIALAVCLHRVSPRWEDVTHDGDLAYLPPTMPSVAGELLLARAFPDNKSKSEIALVVERPGAPLSADDLAWADELAADFEPLSDELGVVEQWTHNTEVIGAKLISRPTKAGQATVILLHLKNEFVATDNIRVLERVQEVIAAAEGRPNAPEGIRVGITGAAAIGGDMLSAAEKSIRNTELTTVVLVVIILLAVYRAPILVMIPLTTIGVSLIIATDLLALLTQVGRLPGFDWWNFKIFTTTKIFIVVILFGSGTDFCLFLVARYKEELERGLDQAAAVAAAIGHVGEALVGSAATTILGLGMMFFADFGKFRNSGPAIALCLFVTLLACLTFAPALLRVTRRAVFWPFSMPRASHHSLATSTGFWRRASEFVVARPGFVLVGSLLVLSPLAYAGRDVPVTYDFLNELDPSCVSVRGTELAKRHFPAGKTTPITLLAFQEDGKFDEKEGEKKIALLTKKLYEIPGVNSVRSIAEPLGDPPGYFQPLRADGLRKLAARKHRLTQATYITQTPELKGDVARFDVAMNDEPFSLAAVGLVNDLERLLAHLSQDANSPWQDTQFMTIGTTVGIRDLKMVTESDQTLIKRLVTLAVLGVLIVILRKPIVSLYLIASVLFSYYVTIGATELAFSWWYGPTFYGLDWKVPIFLFVILVAVGEDYNIYLVTRVLEEQRRLGPLAGLREAVARTGGIITSCGVIMAGTFVSMMTSSLRGMMELGFSLSLGVLLDTCIVRPLLVPAFLAILERTRARWSGSSASLNSLPAAASSGS